LPYQKIAAVLKYLSIVLLVYLIIPFLYKQDWIAVLKATFVPTIKFDKDFISILVAILGTTFRPIYSFGRHDGSRRYEKEEKTFSGK
jgi:Mn2+/Fe2+ NRAMP family transporter